MKRPRPQVLNSTVKCYDCSKEAVTEYTCRYEDASRATVETVAIRCACGYLYKSECRYRKEQVG